MVIYDSSGVNTLTNCNFTGNKIALSDRDIFSGGGGLHIEITSCPPGVVCPKWNDSLYDGKIDSDNTSFRIEDCTFFNNTASSIFERDHAYVLHRPVEKQRLGRGGGLYVGIGRSVFNLTVRISNCKFIQNSALFGGGMFASLKDAVSSTTFMIIDSDFIEKHFGKGRWRRCFVLEAIPVHQMQNNTFEVVGSTFSGNYAPFYGGVVVGTGSVRAGRDNGARFVQCKWLGNRAHFSAALGVSSRRGTRYDKRSIVFDSCTFRGNAIIPRELDVNYVHYSSYTGAVISISYEYVNFENENEFEGNFGSVFWLVSSTVEFLSPSIVNFRNNSGHRGGALSLVGNSLMLLNRNSHFYFRNNTAISVRWSHLCGSARRAKSLHRCQSHLPVTVQWKVLKGVE